jgi:predicted dinucleotide-binding enzyme
MGPRASAKSIEQAAAAAEIIFLAVPYEAVDELVPSLTSPACGKIVIDATNPFSLSQEGRVISSLVSGLTAGSRLASLLPKSTVVRAFSHVMDELLVSRGTTQPG